jgi:hypothetical protein
VCCLRTVHSGRVRKFHISLTAVRVPVSAPDASAGRKLSARAMLITARTEREHSEFGREVILNTGTSIGARTLNTASVRAGRLSSWAATRIVAPLARANPEHADRLLMALSQAPLSTRELRRWFGRACPEPNGSSSRLYDQPEIQAAAEALGLQGLSMWPGGPGHATASLFRPDKPLRAARNWPMGSAYFSSRMQLPSEPASASDSPRSLACGCV